MSLVQQLVYVCTYLMVSHLVHNLQMYVDGQMQMSHTNYQCEGHTTIHKCETMIMWDGQQRSKDLLLWGT